MRNMNRQIQRLLQTPSSRHFEALTIGYLVALNGFQEPAEMADSEDYRRGHTMGIEALQAGKLPLPFLGYYTDKDLPLKKGQEITIPKGVMVHHRGKAALSTRARKVQINHFISGTNLHIRQDHHREDITHMTSPRVVWAGSGGYWSEVDINDIPEAVKAAKDAQHELDQQSQQAAMDEYLQILASLFSRISETATGLMESAPRDGFDVRFHQRSDHFQGEAVIDGAVVASFTVDTYCEIQKVKLKVNITSNICLHLAEARVVFRALELVMLTAEVIEREYCHPWNRAQ